MKRLEATAESYEPCEDSAFKKAKLDGGRSLLIDSLPQLLNDLSFLEDITTDESAVAALTDRALRTVGMLCELKLWIELSQRQLHEGDFATSVIHDMIAQLDSAQRVGRLLIVSINSMVLHRAERQLLHKKGKLGTEQSYALVMASLDENVANLLRKWKSGLFYLTALLADMVHKNLIVDTNGHAAVRGSVQSSKSPNMSRKGQSNAPRKSASKVHSRKYH